MIFSKGQDQPKWPTAPCLLEGESLCPFSFKRPSPYPFRAKGPSLGKGPQHTGTGLGRALPPAPPRTKNPHWLDFGHVTVLGTWQLGVGLEEEVTCSLVHESTRRQMLARLASVTGGPLCKNTVSLPWMGMEMASVESRSIPARLLA